MRVAATVERVCIHHQCPSSVSIISVCTTAPPLRAIKIKVVGTNTPEWANGFGHGPVRGVGEGVLAKHARPYNEPRPPSMPAPTTSLDPQKSPYCAPALAGERVCVECVVYWYSFSNPRTKCIHCDNCLVIKKKCVLPFSRGSLRIYFQGVGTARRLPLQGKGVNSTDRASGRELEALVPRGPSPRRGADSGTTATT